MQEGQIYKIHSDFYYIEEKESSKLFTCKLREVIKKRRDKVIVGDFVKFQGEHIEEILPRNSYISRPHVSNVDQIIIVTSLKEPALDLHQLDRYIALAKYFNIKSVLCFNKEDLEDDIDTLKNIMAIYEPLNCEIIFTSATEKNGIDRFKKLLSNKVSVLCGNSGVGKSSLINAINPDFNLKTKEVSGKLQRGTHTTRHSEIIKITENSKIVDTPGFSNLRFDFIMPAEVDTLFEEITIYQSECKFKDCLHINEDGCNVLAHMDKIPDSRYESYLAFVEEARDYKEKVKYEGRKTESTQKTINNKAVTKISEKKRKTSRRKMHQEVYKDFEYENE